MDLPADSAPRPDSGPDRSIVRDSAAIPDTKRSCKAQDATPVGLCDMLLGSRWDGKACKQISGCSCAGSDCGQLYSKLAACVSDYAHCP